MSAGIRRHKLSGQPVWATGQNVVVRGNVTLAGVVGGNRMAARHVHTVAAAGSPCGVWLSRTPVRRPHRWCVNYRLCPLQVG